MSRAQKGRKHSPEHREKIGRANKGQKRSPESRAKMSRAQKGRKHSPEHREKIDRANKGWKHSPEAREKIGLAAKGRKHSPEAREKIGLAAKGRTYPPEVRAKMSVSQKKRFQKLTDITKGIRMITKPVAKYEALGAAITVLSNSAYIPDARDFPREIDQKKVAAAFEEVIEDLKKKLSKQRTSLEKKGITL